MKKANASHILVKTEQEANVVYYDVTHGKHFDEVAKSVSIDKGSGKKGGDLGWFGRGQMVKEFENAAFSMKKGEIKIAKSQFGWHVIKLIDSK